MRRRTYPKPQTLTDWRHYRLTDLFEFFSVPENERKVFRWIMDTEKPAFTQERRKIGDEWYIVFSLFRQAYDTMQQKKLFQKTIEELEAIRNAGVRR